MMEQMKKSFRGMNFKHIMLWALLFAVVAFLAAEANSVYAAAAPPEPNAADSRWDAIMTFLTTWLGRLGGAVTLIGGVMFGLGWQRDDAESKTAGLRTIIAGLIVIAVGVSSNVFLG